MGGWGAPLLVAATVWSLLEPRRNFVGLSYDVGTVQPEEPEEREKVSPHRYKKPYLTEEPTSLIGPVTKVESCVVRLGSLNALPSWTSPIK